MTIYKPNQTYTTKKDKQTFYYSKVWRRFRQQILKRDNYECQACKEEGKVKITDPSKHKSLDVDHILELETHPELAFEPTNLRTLCIVCHNKKHDRTFANGWGSKRYIKESKNPWKSDEKW